MSLELMAKNEEKSELTPHETLVKDLREQFETDLLDLGVVHEIPQPKNPDQTMASHPDQRSGVFQDLRAVVKTGQEMFFVIDASIRVSVDLDGFRRPSYVNSTLFAKQVPGETAQILDFSRQQIDFEQRDIPRHLKKKVVSRDAEFIVAQGEDGVFGILNENPAEPIEVFKQKLSSGSDEEPSKLILRGDDAWCVHSKQVFGAIKQSIIG